MTKITNENYRKFLDEGIIKTIEQPTIEKALKNIKGSHYKEKRACLIALYLTGGRPNEVLDTQGQDLKREDNYVLYFLKGSKGGLPRTIHLQWKNPLVQELYIYAQGCFPGMLIFYHLRSNYVRTVTNKKGETKEVIETTAKLRYHVGQWFAGIIDDSIPPYYLRHNRFSKLALDGVDQESIRMLKGGRRIESVSPYLHLSSKKSKDLARKIK